MADRIKARTRGNGEWQALSAHHAGVAELASSFSPAWLDRLISLLAEIHDVGKSSGEFQFRLAGGPRVDHSTAAYLHLLQYWGESKEGRIFARLLAWPLLGHHGGLKDAGNPAQKGSLAHRLSAPYLSALPSWKPVAAKPLPPETYASDIHHAVAPDGACDAFSTAFMLRMLHSLLVDADWLDAERFSSPERYAARPKPVPLPRLEKRFLSFLRAKKFLSLSPAPVPSLSGDKTEAIRNARRYMLGCCLEKAGESRGIFSLTMPTGGGKTLSSMAFALSHAVRHKMARIVVVSPYTTIIEQNADILRKAMGKDAVLEHHASYSHPDGKEDEMAKLAAENWDASVIITTSVQFFESLFASKTSRCRKLHNIAGSVIILDEIQMLPVPFVLPCLAALRELARSYGCSIVLCTATQPAFLRSPSFPQGLAPESVREIIPQDSFPSLFRIFDRARTEIWEKPVDDAELAERIREIPQVLCIVNSRIHARDLFLLLGPGEENFHLSARMTPEHRGRTFGIIRERLAKGLPCRVISTSLVECGVDISFPTVMREKNGLDILVQSAGRCNREGREKEGRFVCFTSTRPVPAGASELNRRRSALDRAAGTDALFHPETIRRYFEKLYAASDLDEEGILDLTRIDAGSDNVWKFEFATIAKKFRFISDDTVSIIVESREAMDVLKKLARKDISPVRVLEKLQRHSVSVYRKEFVVMEANGRIRYEYRIFPVLVDGYDEKTGVIFEDVKKEN